MILKQNLFFHFLNLSPKLTWYKKEKIRIQYLSRVAQLVERLTFKQLVCDQNVQGSSPCVGECYFFLVHF